MLKCYRYFPEKHGHGDTAMTVAHSCGHSTIYNFGGSAPYYDACRKAFAEDQTAKPCPDCVAISKAISLPMVDDIVLPVVQGDIGNALLTTCDPRAEGLLLLVADEERLLERTVESPLTGEEGRLCPRVIWYTFATRLYAPPANYLHKRDDIEYTPKQLAWVHRYIVREFTEEHFGNTCYAFGASFKTDAQKWDIDRWIASNGGRLYVTSL